MGRRSSVHVLDALVAIVGTAHVEVNLEVCEGLQCYLDLHILCLGYGGRCGHTVACYQPSAFFCFVEV